MARVFISYKRLTAEDFASHLKKGLEAESIPAFLDIEDIPRMHKGTEQWWKHRDDGIRKSDVFLLILTDGIESSLEVKKEIILARKIENMRFLLLRHEGLEPQIMIDLKDSKLNLGMYNQTEFNTKHDLLRKVLRILKGKTEAPELVDIGYNQKLSHVEARLFYPTSAQWEYGERDPHRKEPRLKLILVTDLRKAYWVGKYAWDLILDNKIPWFSDDEQDLEEWCKKEGYALIPRAATEQNLLEPFFHSEIVGKRRRYRQGEVVIFRTRYRGELNNGFFDNEILMPNGKIAWNWAPDTLENSLPDTPGKLNGYVNHTSTWSWTIPLDAPKGKYRVYMRVYNHFGAHKRPVIEEKQETIVVVPRFRDKIRQT